MHLHQFILSWFFPAFLKTKSYFISTDFWCLYNHSQDCACVKRVVEGNLFILGCCGKSTHLILLISVSESNSVTGLIFSFFLLNGSSLKKTDRKNPGL